MTMQEKANRPKHNITTVLSVACETEISFA